ncbi:MAG: Asp-tRNA(Asn)/Glu-tRNA(Gln) amidotransferase subunit GatC [Bdellovibrionota bacterium]
MIEVNEELTRKVAELARLELSENEVKAFTGQLDVVLKYIELLQQVDLVRPDGSAIEPLVNPMETETPFLRPDRSVDKSVQTRGITDGDGYKVPQII